jgi:hypothetical protein
MLGGIVICGRTDWILFTKTSLTSEVIRLDFPVPSSPHTQILTTKGQLDSSSKVPLCDYQLPLSLKCKGGFKLTVMIFSPLLNRPRYPVTLEVLNESVAFDKG